MKILSRDPPQRIFIKGERLLVFPSPFHSSAPTSALYTQIFMLLRSPGKGKRKRPVGGSRKSPENEIRDWCHQIADHRKTRDRPRSCRYKFLFAKFTISYLIRPVNRLVPQHEASLVAELKIDRCADQIYYGTT